MGIAPLHPSYGLGDYGLGDEMRDNLFTKAELR
jgi:hypothetical protein